MYSLFRPFFLLFFLFCGLIIFGQDKSNNDYFTPKLMPAKGHTDYLWKAQFSPDKRHVLTASWDNTAKVWDAQNGKLLIDLVGHKATVSFAQYNNNGTIILTASEDNTAKIWDAKNGNLLHDLVGHTNRILSANFSPDNTQIITSGIDSTAKIWDTNTGELLFDIKEHNDFIVYAEYSSNQKYVLTASYDNTIKIWDTGTIKLVNTLFFKASPIKVRFSPNNKLILSSHKDNTINLWEVSTGKLIFNVKAHDKWINAAQFSPNGKEIVTASDDKTAKIWGAHSGELLLEFQGHTNRLNHAIYSPNGKEIVTSSGDKTVKIWDAHSGDLKQTLKHTSPIIVAQYSVDGKLLITGCSDNTGKVWDATSGNLLVDLRGYTSAIKSLQFSPDGKQFVIASRDKTAKIFSSNSFKMELELKGHSREVISAQYSPNGKKIITGSHDKTAKIWDAISGKLLLDLTGHTNHVWAAEFSPDGNSIVTGCKDDTVRIWKAGTGELISKFEFELWSTRFSPDGENLIISGAEVAKIINIVSGKEQISFKGHNNWLESASYSPNGKKVVTASGDNTAKIWDANSGSLLFDLTGHKGIVKVASFSPNGKHILSSSRDNTIKLWDAESGKEIHSLIGHNGDVNDAQVSPNGDYILSVSEDGSLIYWDIKTSKKLMTVYPLADHNWIVLHPSGLFDASPQAMKWMYYLMGTEVIELEQLKERFYEPGLFEKVMAQDGSLRDVEAFVSVEMYPKIESYIEEQKIHIQLQERNGGIGKVSLFINNKEVISDANPNRDTILIFDLTQFDKYYLGDATNTVSFRVYNADGWLKSSAISHNYIPEFVNKRGVENDDDEEDLLFGVEHNPKLYAVVIGSADYVGENLDLRYADKDSKDIASAIGQTSQLLFGTKNVHMDWFTSVGMSGSKLSSKKNIKAAFDSIAISAKAEDILLVYLSGHGVTYGDIEKEQFYYLTKDVNSGDLTDPQIRSSYTISTEELTQWINSIAAQKQVMILDACSSGKVVEELLVARDVPTSQIRVLDRMKDRTGMFVLAGSAADMVSYEASQFGQGLLTYSLLLGISGAALKDGESVDIMNLFQFARDQVPEFARDIGGVQTPTLAFPSDASSFDIGLINDEIEIPLQEVKPLFTRSSLEEEESWDDIANISKSLDSHLIDASAGSLSKGIIFVDVNTYENAYSIKGRYHYEEEKIIILGRLFKGKEKVDNFKVTGDKNQNDKVVESILNKVIDIINRRKEKK